MDDRIFWGRWKTGHRLRVRVKYVKGTKKRFFVVEELLEIKLPRNRRRENPETHRQQIWNTIKGNTYSIGGRVENEEDVVFYINYVSEDVLKRRHNPPKKYLPVRE